MKETLLRSVKERRRMVRLTQVKEGEMSLAPAARRRKGTFRLSPIGDISKESRQACEVP